MREVPGLDDLAPAAVLDDGEGHVDGAQAGLGDAGRQGQAHGGGGPGPGDGVGVAEHGDVPDLDADGVEGIGGGGAAAVDGAGELGQLLLALLGLDQAQNLADGLQGRPRAARVEGPAGERVVAEATHLQQRGLQPLGRVEEAALVGAVGGQDADLGGQVGQVGDLRGGLIAVQECAQGLRGAVIAESGTQIALQLSGQDAEETSQDEVAIVKLHSGTKWGVGGGTYLKPRPGRTRS